MHDQSDVANKTGALNFRAPRDIKVIDEHPENVLRLQDMLAVFKLLVAGVTTVKHCFPG
jgi:hypothetical protein